MRRLLFPALLLLASAYALPEAAQAQRNAQHEMTIEIEKPAVQAQLNIAREELADSAMTPSELAKARELISAEDLADLRQMARQGYSFAQYSLGLMYEAGQGVPQSDMQAAHWVRLAAEQGLYAAQSELGAMYFDGRGVPKNYIASYMWAVLGAARGNEAAKLLRDSVFERLTPAERSRTHDLASECSRQDYKNCAY